VTVYTELSQLVIQGYAYLAVYVYGRLELYNIMTLLYLVLTTSTTRLQFTYIDHHLGICTYFVATYMSTISCPARCSPKKITW